MTTTPDHVKFGSPLDIALQAAARAGVRPTLVDGRWRMDLTLDNLREVVGAVHLGVTDQRKDAYAEGYKQGQLDARMDALNSSQQLVGDPTVNGHGKWCASLHAPAGLTYACDCNEEGSG